MPHGNDCNQVQPNGGKLEPIESKTPQRIIGFKTGNDSEMVSPPSPVVPKKSFVFAEASTFVRPCTPPPHPFREATSPVDRGTKLKTVGLFDMEISDDGESDNDESDDGVPTPL